jgi:hypothetical protein
MTEPALRSLAVAGVLAMTFVFGGLGAVPALADDPSEPDSSSQDAGDTGGSEEPGGSEAVPNEPDDPADPADGGPAEEPADDEVVNEPGPVGPVESDGSGGLGDPVVDEPAPVPTMRTPYSNSITIPFFRLPAAGEIPAGSFPSVSSFYTTIEIPVPTLGEFLRSLQYVPAPAPAPGPQFRTQEEAPVADATTGTTTGGGGGNVMSEPAVFQAPLVTVPRAVTMAGKPPRTAPGAPAGAAVPPGVTQPGVAGVRTPAIRGSVGPTPGVSAKPAATPQGASTTTAAYPRSVMNPTVAEIAAVAAPGVVGLLFLTFSGGVIGYRQANSGRYVRTAGADRFLP